MMKQIILITDGCSNEGLSPVAAAASAHAEGVVVNVIGVVDHGDLEERGRDEISQIAAAGGGMSRIVATRQLAQTVQMMTRKTVTHTIHQVVNRELKQILGEGRVEDLPPHQRSKVVQVMDELSEHTSLKVALLIDTSASMKSKLQAVEEAIYDLMLSLQARQGDSKIGVFHYPGNQGEAASMVLNWTSEVAKMTNLFYKLNIRGTTPTGPALLKLTQLLTYGNQDVEMNEYSEPAKVRHPKDGMLSDYIV